MNMSDAAVALRSLPRRFSEVVAGPAGDPSWERTVRTVGPDGRSALGFVVHATELLIELGTAIASLPVKARPSMSIDKLERRYSEPATGASTAQLIGELRLAAERAATAVEGRDHDELDRACSVDNEHVKARTAVERVVTTTVRSLGEAQAAIDAAL
jgi:hypothetical protein